MLRQHKMSTKLYIQQESRPCKNLYIKIYTHTRLIPQSLHKINTTDVIRRIHKIYMPPSVITYMYSICILPNHVLCLSLSLTIHHVWYLLSFPNYPSRIIYSLFPQLSVRYNIYMYMYHIPHLCNHPLPYVPGTCIIVLKVWFPLIFCPFPLNVYLPIP